MRRPLLILPLAVFALMPAPAAAAPLKLDGVTDQCDAAREPCPPVHLAVDARQTRVSRLSIEWTATCRAGGVPVREVTTVRNLVITRGRFAAAGAYEVDLGSGLTGEVSGRLAGRVRRDGAAGTFSAAVTIVDAARRGLDVCETPAIAWRARPR